MANPVSRLARLEKREKEAYESAAAWNKAANIHDLERIKVQDEMVAAQHDRVKKLSSGAYDIYRLRIENYVQMALGCRVEAVRHYKRYTKYRKKREALIRHINSPMRHAAR